MAAFDAIVISGPGSALKVAGLRLDERARRVAKKAGAVRVLVIAEGSAKAIADEAGPRTGTIDLVAWAAEADRELVVLDATDHVVHVPLVQAALATEVVTDPETHTFAGAIHATGPACAALAHAAVSSDTLAAFAAARRAEGAPSAPHADLSRHVARGRADNAAAVHFLFGLIRKAQDTWLVRNVNRKVSYPFTRLLLPLAWLSPNMISVCVFIIGAIGCIIATQPTYSAALIGASMLLFAGYLDGCDGEVARIRLESSKIGAWIDTIADEVTTILSVTCFGIHVYREYHYGWLAPVVVIMAFLSLVSVLSIYYYLLTSGSGSGNSQDYPTTNPILNILRYMIRREVINLGVFFGCLFGLVDEIYMVLALGAVISSAVLFTQQIQRALAKRKLPKTTTAGASVQAAQARGQAPS